VRGRDDEKVFGVKKKRKNILRMEFVD